VMKSPVDDQLHQRFFVLPTPSLSSLQKRPLHWPHDAGSPAIRPPTHHRRLDAARRRRPRPSADRRRGEPPRRGVHLDSVSRRRPSPCRRRVVDVVPGLLRRRPRRNLKPPPNVVEGRIDNTEVKYFISHID